MTNRVYSLNESIFNSSRLNKERVAIESSAGKKQLTYLEFYEEVRNTAYFMSQLGAGKDDKVAICLENRAEWPIIFFASLYLGAVCVPLDSQLTNKDIENILLDSDSKFIFINNESKKLKGFLTGFGAIKSAISLGAKNIEGKFFPYPDKSLSIPKGFDYYKAAPDDLALLLYTSGTTSLPKGVMLTHKNLCSNFYSIDKYNILSRKDVFLSILPLHHSYPIMITLIAPLLLGAKIFYAGADWPEQLVNYIKGSKTTILTGVPQIYNAMHQKIKKKLASLPMIIRPFVRFLLKARPVFGRSLRFFACGGAKLDKEVTIFFSKIGVKILEGYGLTETSPVVSFNPLNKPMLGSIGKALPDVEVKFINKNKDGIGEIVIRGPNVMKGYYKDEDKTRSAFKDGFFLSGDLGYIDKKGYIYITGRSKEVIVLSTGKNIYPDEVEKHYASSPYIKEICVLGVSKAQAEYLHAVIVPDFDFFNKRGELNMQKSIKESLEALSQGLPGYKHIMGFSVTKDAFPRTTLGKLKRYEIEKKYLPVILNEEAVGEEATLEEKALLGLEASKKLIKCLKENFNIKKSINLNDSIELDLGMDSLGRIELVSAIEKCFSIELDEEMAGGNIFTIKDLILKIEENLKKGLVEKTGISWHHILNEGLKEEFKKKIYFKTGPIDVALSILVKGFVSLFFRVFYRLKVEGVSNLPKGEAYCLCVNHTSFLDGFIVSAGIPFKAQYSLFYIGFRKYFEAPIVRNLVARARIIPVDSSQVIEAMQAAYFVLKNNKALCIFPEGSRSRDGSLKEFKKGIGIIGKELEVKFIPTLIKGAYEAWPPSKRFPKPHPISIRFGKPIYSSGLLEKGRKLCAKNDFEAITMALRDEVEALSS